MAIGTALRYGTAPFAEALARLRNRGDADFSKVEPAVREILDAVRREGDAAVLRYIERFERRRPSSASLLKRDYGGEAALARLPVPVRRALELAAQRITRFHEEERRAGFATAAFTLEEEFGAMVGLRVRPLRRVGVYAPGGKARYPSSVLMSALPARVAGVEDILLATPLAGPASSADGAASAQALADDAVLAAAFLAGVTGLVDAGGAQAIGALAYGTETVPRVDKVVGPGNAFVACAKRLTYGTVAIDSIAGPSEILVVADETADPAHVAADLLSQAEHDEDAYPLLVSIADSDELVRAVSRELERQLADLPRAAMARAALAAQGFALVVPDRARAAETADIIAPEHLSLHVRDPDGLSAEVRNAGAIFVGALTPEAVGDYLAGPSHVLPTGGVVRFGSPLGVHDFVARTSVVRYSLEALRRDAQAITELARLEGLEAHARAVEVRTGARRAVPDGDADRA